MRRFFSFSLVWVIFSLFFVVGGLGQAPPTGSKGKIVKKDGAVLESIGSEGQVQDSLAGFQPGAKVRIVKKDGSVLEGKIVKATESIFYINTPQGNVKKYLKDIKKITDTGKTDLGGGISYRPVHEYVTTNDQSFQGVYFNGEGMIFEVDLGAVGPQRFWIESLKSIELVHSGAAVASECIVTCPHCGKPIKIMLGKDNLASSEPVLEKIGGK